MLVLSVILKVRDENILKTSLGGEYLTDNYFLKIKDLGKIQLLTSNQKQNYTSSQKEICSEENKKRRSTGLEWTQGEEFLKSSLFTGISTFL